MIGQGKRTSGRQASRQGVVLTTVLAAATIGAVVWLIGQDPMRAERIPHRPGFAASGPMFRSLRQLVFHSDAVVVGTVDRIRPGELQPDPEYPTRDVIAVIQIREVLAGSASRSTVDVETLELSYAGDADWRTVGTRVVAFVRESAERRGQGISVPTSYSQSFYTLRAAGDIVPVVQERGLTQEIGSLSLRELRRALTDLSQGI